MKRIFALVLSFAVLFSCLVLPAGAMFDPTPVYQVQAQSAYIVKPIPISSSMIRTAQSRYPPVV